jgi:Uma2 family endonuclease
MNAPARTRMTTEQFLAWENRQERKHELVDGVVRLMAGGTINHYRIARNVIVAFTTRLRGNPCEPFGSDVRLRTPNGDIRYLDVMIDCGSPKGADTVAAAPTVVVEVLSPSTEWFDQTRKLEDYQSIPSVAQIAFLAQDRPFARLWTRAGAGWDSAEFDGMQSALNFSAVSSELPFAEIYDGVAFETASAAQ